ncbi:MAG TPA: 3-hydroxyacyl-CoA dehydrogenase family protein [Cyclobacteriaceae bacterium]
MNILIVGNDDNLIEAKQKFGESHSYTLTQNQAEAENSFSTSDLIFDFNLDNNPSQIKRYATHSSPIVFINTSKINLAELGSIVNHEINCSLFGFCGLPTFLNRPLLELTLYQNKNKEKLGAICLNLNTKFSLVEDRVGLVTPRVICMIINEAYYTLEEGTATREDIDLAMKLGTNYPFGPFEWAQRIGVMHVYELLDAVYKDTKDERYKTCALLKEEYLLIK